MAMQGNAKVESAVASAHLGRIVENTINAKQRFIADVLTDKPVKQYRMDDYGAIRNTLLDNVKDAVAKRFPLYNDRYIVKLENVDYENRDEIPLAEQKQAIMEGGSCFKKLKGNWALEDALTGKVVSRTGRTTLMKVPYMTDRGTFIRNGHEYVFTNIMRLEPGVYTKRKNNEIDAQFNVKKGTGSGFNMKLVPNTGVFMVNRKTVNAPAYTVFRDMGITDDQMKEAWGPELFEKNRNAGSGEKARQAADKIYNM